MATIVTRAGKGSPLTHIEVDANFTNLNNDKAELASPALTGNVTVATNSASPALKVTQTGAGPAFLVEDSASTDASPFVIDYVGSVGIGTTTPEASLDINGNAFVRGAGSEGGEIAFFNPDRTITGMTVDISSANVGRIFQAQNNSILQLGQLVGTGGVVTLHTAATERMRIDSSGNVGIGTTAPPSQLTVAGNGQLVSALTDGGARTGSIQIHSTSNLSGAGGALLFSGTVNNGTTSQWAIKSMLFDGAANGTADLIFSGRAATSDASLSERMRLTNTGRVGIGTSSPSASAIVDVQSTTRGVRFPNMTTTQKNAIANVAGNVVFDTTLGKLCVNTGSAWQTITSV